MSPSSLSSSSLPLSCQAEAYFESDVPRGDIGSYTELVAELHRTELYVHQFDYEAALKTISPLVRRRREPYPDAGWTAEMAARNIEYLSSASRMSSGQVALVAALREEKVTAQSIARRLAGQTEGMEATTECMHALVQLRVDPANLQVR